jgi:hypothetical protein
MPNHAVPAAATGSPSSDAASIRTDADPASGFSLDQTLGPRTSDGGAEEGKRDMGRMEFISSTSAKPVALTLNPPVEVDPVFAAIENHCRVEAEFRNACHQEAPEAVNEQSYRAAENSRAELVATVPQTAEGIRAVLQRALYFYFDPDAYGCVLPENEIETLMRSILASPALTNTDFPAEADEVVELAIRLQSVHDRSEKLFKESASFEAYPANYYKSAESDSYEQEYILEDVISITKATTLAGASIHIAGALIRFARLLDLYEDVEETYELKKERRTVERLLYSALDVVDGFADQKLELTIPHLANSHLNPWTPVEQRIARIDAERAQDEKQARKAI